MSEKKVLIGKYQLITRIGSGSYGKVYKGVNIKNGEMVAIKMERRKALCPLLSNEYKLYKVLRYGEGFPKALYFGLHGKYNVLVMELLGPSLEDLFNYCNRHFSIKTVTMLARQMIKRTSHLHKNNIIHRDINSSNFLMGIAEPNKVYMIDFGLSKQHRKPLSDMRVMYRKHKGLIGTGLYTSIGVHYGFEQSRRDDMESLGYVIMYFTLGSLPWQGLKGCNREQYEEQVFEKKLSTSIEQLCEGFPAEFSTYLNYCRDLACCEEPDYHYLDQLFATLYNTQNNPLDYFFDWALMKPKGYPLPRVTSESTREDKDEQPTETEKSKF